MTNIESRPITDEAMRALELELGAVHGPVLFDEMIQQGREVAQNIAVPPKKMAASAMIATTLATGAPMIMNARPVAAVERIEDADVVQAGDEVLVPQLDGSNLTVTLGKDLLISDLAESNHTTIDAIVQATNQAAAPAETHQEAPAPREQINTQSQTETPSTTSVEVKVGDTLTKISAETGVSVDSIADANGLANPDKIFAGQQLVLPGVAEQAPQASYTVRDGDTLFEIAKKLGTTTQDLASINGLNNPNLIFSNQVLKVPGSPAVGTEQSQYTVQPGDVLSDVAQRYGVSVTDIAQASGVRNPDRIMPNQVLTIPGQVTAEAPAPEPQPVVEAVNVSNDVAPVTAPEVTHMPSGIGLELGDSMRGQIEAALPNIDALRSAYEEVEARTGVPWEALAAIHYREANNAPDRSMWAGEKLGSVNPDHGDVKSSDLVENGVEAAESLKGFAAKAYGVEVGPNMDADDLKYLFLTHNRGYMYKNASKYIGRELSADESPYVMNGVAGFEDMHFFERGSLSKGWGEPESVQGKADSRPGALAIYIALVEREQQESLNQYLASLAAQEQAAQAEAARAEAAQAPIVEIPVAPAPEEYPQPIGDLTESSVDVPCAPGTDDLGIQEGFNKGQPLDIRVCGIPSIASSAGESNPDNTFYIDGANGNLVVNSRVSGTWLALGEAAIADGIPLSGVSGFRSNQHQLNLWFSNGENPTYVARAGFSDHQLGLAADFAQMGVKGGTTCGNMAREPGNVTWEWMNHHAPLYGMIQLPQESWHYDPLGNTPCE